MAVMRQMMLSGRCEYFTAREMIKLEINTGTRPHPLAQSQISNHRIRALYVYVTQLTEKPVYWYQILQFIHLQRSLVLSVSGPGDDRCK